MAAHTLADLYQMQALPLDIKVRMTIQRIDGWIDEYGKEGVCVSFSGGKDSTVLMDIIRNEMGENILATFVDVPTQYPELRDFAKTWNNVEILKPKISFMEVCERYGFPLISKEVAECAYDARKYLDKVRDMTNLATDRQTDRQIANSAHFADMVGIPRRGKEKQNEIYLNLKKGIIPNDLEYLYKISKENGKVPVRVAAMWGEVQHKEKGVLTDEISERYDKSKYKFLLEAPFSISSLCCDAMKKAPLHEFQKKTGRFPITAQMADESLLRRQKWLQHGCNGFDMKSPISNPMSFWTEQDVLQYIKTRNLPICSVYGDVVIDYEKMGELQGQSFLFETGIEPLKTTGCKRTGCMLCGFGCHAKDDTRFLQLKETHPKMYNLLDVVKNNGVTFREAIEWTNEHGNLNIKL